MMIVSASRRTDIPAFFAPWFMNRVRAGYCLVPNPFNSKQVSRISLLPEDIDAFVFWSKNPQPMIEHLPELDSRGYAYYFLFTLNDYPLWLEPKLPALARRLATFKILSERLGSDRAVWRYDPIVISTATPHEYHRERFSRLSRELSSYTRRVVVSIVHFYRKTDRRLSELERNGIRFDRDAGRRPETLALLSHMSATAAAHGMQIQSCAQERDYAGAGVPPGACIDAGLIGLLGRPAPHDKDPGQRAACRCVVSRDIGVNDTCLHGCPYCYATSNNELASLRFSTHDPLAPALWSRDVAANNAVRDSA